MADGTEGEGFSVGVFVDFDAEALLSRRDLAVTGLTRVCDRVAVWHHPVEAWRATLVKTLLGGPLRGLKPRGVARLGRRQPEMHASNAVERFLESTEPAPAIHERHLLMLHGPDQLAVVLLSDVDGAALDVFLSGPASNDVARRAADAAWSHLLRLE